MTKSYASRRIPGQRDRSGTERDSCPDMSYFVVPRDVSTGVSSVAMSHDHGPNPENLRDRDRNPDIVLGQPYP